MNSRDGTLAVAEGRASRTADVPSVAQFVQPLKDEELDLFNLLSVIWWRKWWIAFCGLIGAVLSVYYLLEIAVPKYASTAHLAFEESNQQIIDVESVLAGSSNEDEAINTEIAIVRSRTLLERLIEAENLREDPEFNPLLDKEINGPSYFDIAKTFVMQDLLGRPPRPPLTEEEKTVLIVNELLEVIQVSLVRNTYLITLTVTTSDQQKSARLANTLTDIYLENQIDIKLVATEFAINFLSQRVGELEADLRLREIEIEQVRGETDLVSEEALELLSVRFKEMRTRLAEARTIAREADEKRRLYEALRQRRDKAEILAAIPDPVLENAAENGQDKRFFDRFELLVEDAILSADREQARIGTLEQAYEVMSQQMSDQKDDLLELNQMIREAEATRVLYETFLNRLKETSVQIGLAQSDSRIISDAVMGKQVKPQSAVVLVIGVFLSILFGMVVAIIVEMRSKGFRTAEQLEQVTGFTVLGQIPTVPEKARKDVIRYLAENPTSASAEAIRNLRTSLLMSNIDAPPKVIMSTSTVPGEGKTTQAVSLAQNLSGLGKRVLLVECDIRRRTLSEYFKTKSGNHLIAVLMGSKKLMDAVTETGFDQVYILAGSRTTSNAADALSSKAFGRMLDEARENFDHIILDTPPVLAVTDARIVSQWADFVLYTVRWDHTPREQVISGLNQLISVGRPADGIVLSQINPKKMKRYGYGNYTSSGSQYYDLK